MIGWLRSQGFSVDCYTDLDLDRGGILIRAGELPRYALMLSAGHHEYWSEPMRGELTRLFRSGGNAAIFSGNTCYRKISFDAQGSAITKENEAWPDSNEASLTGVSYSQGGGWWGQRRGGGWVSTERPPIGYTVTAPGHWVLKAPVSPRDTRSADQNGCWVMSATAWFQESPRPVLRFWRRLA